MVVKRTLYADLDRHIEAREITVLTGARQAGKSTLLKAMDKELTAQGKKTAFFNLDILFDSQYFKTQDTFLRKLKLEFGSRARVCIH